MQHNRRWGKNNSLVVVRKYLVEEIFTRQGMYVKLNAQLCSHFAVEKQSLLRILIVCLYLRRLHKMSMSHDILSCGLSGSTIFFFTLSYKRHNFRKKKLFNTKCVF